MDKYVKNGKVFEAKRMIKNDYHSYFCSNVSFLHRNEDGYVVVNRAGHKTWLPKQEFESSFKLHTVK